MIYYRWYDSLPWLRIWQLRPTIEKATQVPGWIATLTRNTTCHATHGMKGISTTTHVKVQWSFNWDWRSRAAGTHYAWFLLIGRVIPSLRVSTRFVSLASFSCKKQAVRSATCAANSQGQHIWQQLGNCIMTHIQCLAVDGPAALWSTCLALCRLGDTFRALKWDLEHVLPSTFCALQPQGYVGMSKKSGPVLCSSISR